MTNDLLKAPEYLSPSSISTFQQCPLKYKYSRIDKLKEPSTKETILGNFVHSIAEAFYSAPPDSRTVTYARHIASEVWATYVDEVKTVVREDELMDFRWNAWWCIENLMKMEVPAKVVFSGIETELNHEISGVKIKGFIDRWSEDDETISITDYKTGKLPKPAYRADKFDQLLIYGIVLSDIHQKEIDLLRLMYLKDGVHIEMSPTPLDIKRVTETIVTVRKEIDKRCVTGKFETKTSKLCGWCHFKTICPEWNKPYDER